MQVPGHLFGLHSSSLVSDPVQFSPPLWTSVNFLRDVVRIPPPQDWLQPDQSFAQSLHTQFTKSFQRDQHVSYFIWKLFFLFHLSIVRVCYKPVPSSHAISRLHCFCLIRSSGMGVVRPAFGGQSPPIWAGTCTSRTSSCSPPPQLAVHFPLGNHAVSSHGST